MALRDPALEEISAKSNSVDDSITQLPEEPIQQEDENSQYNLEDIFETPGNGGDNSIFEKTGQDSSASNAPEYRNISVERGWVIEKGGTFDLSERKKESIANKSSQMTGKASSYVRNIAAYVDEKVENEDGDSTKRTQNMVDNQGKSFFGKNSDKFRISPVDSNNGAMPVDAPETWHDNLKPGDEEFDGWIKKVGVHADLLLENGFVGSRDDAFEKVFELGEQYKKEAEEFIEANDLHLISHGESGHYGRGLGDYVKRNADGSPDYSISLSGFIANKPYNFAKYTKYGKEAVKRQLDADNAENNRTVEGPVSEAAHGFKNTIAQFTRETLDTIIRDPSDTPEGRQLIKDAVKAEEQGEAPPLVLTYLNDKKKMKEIHAKTKRSNPRRGSLPLEKSIPDEQERHAYIIARSLKDTNQFEWLNPTPLEKTKKGSVLANIAAASKRTKTNEGVTKELGKQDAKTKITNADQFAKKGLKKEISDDNFLKASNQYKKGNKTEAGVTYVKSFFNASKNVAGSEDVAEQVGGSLGQAAFLIHPAATATYIGSKVSTDVNAYSDAYVEKQGKAPNAEQLNNFAGKAIAIHALNAGAFKFQLSLFKPKGKGGPSKIDVVDKAITNRIIDVESILNIKKGYLKGVVDAGIPGGKTAVIGAFNFSTKLLKGGASEVIPEGLDSVLGKLIENPLASNKELYLAYNEGAAAGAALGVGMAGAGGGIQVAKQTTEAILKKRKPKGPNEQYTTKDAEDAFYNIKARAGKKDDVHTAGFANIAKKIISNEGSGHDIVFGYNKWRKKGDKQLSSMNVNEAIEYQKEMLNRQRKADPNADRSSAIGMGQFVSKTFLSVVESMNLTGKERMTPELQLEMMIHHIKNEGGQDFIDNKINEEQFYQKLSVQWASLKKLKGETYTYNGKEQPTAGDFNDYIGLIKSLKAGEDNDSLVIDETFVNRRGSGVYEAGNLDEDGYVSDDDDHEGSDDNSVIGKIKQARAAVLGEKKTKNSKPAPESKPAYVVNPDSSEITGAYKHISDTVFNAVDDTTEEHKTLVKEIEESFYPIAANMSHTVEDVIDEDLNYYNNETLQKEYELSEESLQSEIETIKKSDKKFIKKAAKLFKKGLDKVSELGESALDPYHEHMAQLEEMGGNTGIKARAVAESIKSRLNTDNYHKIKNDTSAYLDSYRANNNDPKASINADIEAGSIVDESPLVSGLSSKPDKPNSDNVLGSEAFIVKTNHLKKLANSSEGSSLLTVRQNLLGRTSNNTNSKFKSLPQHAREIITAAKVGNHKAVVDTNRKVNNLLRSQKAKLARINAAQKSFAEGRQTEFSLTQYGERSVVKSAKGLDALEAYIKQETIVIEEFLETVIPSIVKKYAVKAPKSAPEKDSDNKDSDASKDIVSALNNQKEESIDNNVDNTTDDSIVATEDTTTEAEVSDESVIEQDNDQALIQRNIERNAKNAPVITADKNIPLPLLFKLSDFYKRAKSNIVELREAIKKPFSNEADRRFNEKEFDESYKEEKAVFFDENTTAMERWKKLFESSDTAVIFDTETTGIELDSDVIQISGLKVDIEGNIIEEFDTYITLSEGGSISTGAQDVHNISEDFLNGSDSKAVDQSKGLLSFIDFIEGSSLVAFNDKFDIGQLQESLSRIDHNYDVLNNHHTFDVMDVRKDMGLNKTNSGTLTSNYNKLVDKDGLKGNKAINVKEAHSSLADVHMTHALLKRFLKTTGDKETARRLADDNETVQIGSLRKKFRDNYSELDQGKPFKIVEGESEPITELDKEDDFEVILTKTAESPLFKQSVSNKPKRTEESELNSEQKDVLLDINTLVEDVSDGVVTVLARHADTAFPSIIRGIYHLPALFNSWFSMPFHHEVSRMQDKQAFIENSLDVIIADFFSGGIKGMSSLSDRAIDSLDYGSSLRNELGIEKETTISPLFSEAMYEFQGTKNTLLNALTVVVKKHIDLDSSYEFASEYERAIYRDKHIDSIALALTESLIQKGYVEVFTITKSELASAYNGPFDSTDYSKIALISLTDKAKKLDLNASITKEILNFESSSPLFFNKVPKVSNTAKDGKALPNVIQDSRDILAEREYTIVGQLSSVINDFSEDFEKFEGIKEIENEDIILFSDRDTKRGEISSKKDGLSYLASTGSYIKKNSSGIYFSVETHRNGRTTDVGLANPINSKILRSFLSVTKNKDPKNIADIHIDGGSVDLGNFTENFGEYLSVTEAELNQFIIGSKEGKLVLTLEEEITLAAYNKQALEKGMSVKAINPALHKKVRVLMAKMVDSYGGSVKSIPAILDLLKLREAYNSAVSNSETSFEFRFLQKIVDDGSSNGPAHAAANLSIPGDNATELDESNTSYGIIAKDTRQSDYDQYEQSGVNSGEILDSIMEEENGGEINLYQPFDEGERDTNVIDSKFIRKQKRRFVELTDKYLTDSDIEDFLTNLKGDLNGRDYASLMDLLKDNELETKVPGSIRKLFKPSLMTKIYGAGNKAITNKLNDMLGEKLNAEMSRILVEMNSIFVTGKQSDKKIDETIRMLTEFYLESQLLSYDDLLDNNGKTIGEVVKEALKERYSETKDMEMVFYDPLLSVDNLGLKEEDSAELVRYIDFRKFDNFVNFKTVHALMDELGIENAMDKAIQADSSLMESINEDVPYDADNATQYLHSLGSASLFGTIVSVSNENSKFFGEVFDSTTNIASETSKLVTSVHNKFSEAISKMLADINLPVNRLVETALKEELHKRGLYSGVSYNLASTEEDNHLEAVKFYKTTRAKGRTSNNALLSITEPGSGKSDDLTGYHVFDGDNFVDMNKEQGSTGVGKNQIHSTSGSGGNESRLNADIGVSNKAITVQSRDGLNMALIITKLKEKLGMDAIQVMDAVYVDGLAKGQNKEVQEIMNEEFVETVFSMNIAASTYKNHFDAKTAASKLKNKSEVLDVLTSVFDNIGIEVGDIDPDLISSLIKNTKDTISEVSNIKEDYSDLVKSSLESQYARLNNLESVSQFGSEGPYIVTDTHKKELSNKLNAVYKDLFGTKAKPNILGSESINTWEDLVADTMHFTTLDKNTVKEAFEVIEKVSSDKLNKSHKNHLLGIINDLVSPAYASLDKIALSFKATVEKSRGAWNIDTGEIAVNISSIPEYHAMNMSAEEVVTHEMVHPIIRNVLESGGVHSDNLRYIYKTIKRHLRSSERGYEAFLPNGEYDSDSVEVKIAKERYAHAFENDSGIDEFLAFALTNEHFQKHVKGLKIKPKKIKGSEYFTGKLDWLNVLLDAIKKGISYIHSEFLNGPNRKKVNMYKSLYKSVSHINKVKHDTKFMRFIGLKPRQSIYNSKYARMANAQIHTRVSKMIAHFKKEIAKNDERKNPSSSDIAKSMLMYPPVYAYNVFNRDRKLGRATRDTIKSYGWHKDSSIIGGAIRGLGIKEIWQNIAPTKRSQLIRDKRGQIERLLENEPQKRRNSIVSLLGETIGKRVSKKVDNAMNRVFNRTDFSSLLDVLSAEDSINILKDDSLIASTQRKLLTEIQRTAHSNSSTAINRRKFYQSSIKATAESLMTGNTKNVNAYNNAYQILFAKKRGEAGYHIHTKEYNDETTARMIALIDASLTLEMLKYVDKSDKRVLVKEFKNDQTYLELYFKALKQASKTAPVHRKHKGAEYTESNRMDVQVSKLKGDKYLKSLGYKLIKGEKIGDKFVYIRKGDKVEELSQGLFSTTYEQKPVTISEGEYLVNRYQGEITSKNRERVARAVQNNIDKYSDNSVVALKNKAIANAIKYGSTSDLKQSTHQGSTDHNGNIIYHIPQNIKNKYFNDTPSGINNLAQYLSREVNLSNTKKVNDNIIDFLFKLKDKFYSDNPKSFITIDRDHPRFGHAFRLLPPHTLNEIERLNEDKGISGVSITIPEDMAHEILGYVGWDSLEVIKNITGNTIKPKKLLSGGIVNAAQVAEHIYKGFISAFKIKQVLINPAVFLGNIRFNIKTLNFVTGASIHYISKNTIEAAKDLSNYHELIQKKDNLQLSIDLYPNQKKLTVKLAKIERLINDNPFKKMDELGFIGGTFEDITLEENPIGRRISSIMPGYDDMKRKYTNEKMLKAVNQADLGSNTEIGAALKMFTTESDVIAKYVMIKYATKDNPIKSERMSEADAILMARSTFIDYSSILPPFIAFLDSIGLSMYTKFKFRSQRAAFRAIVEKPTAVLAESILSDLGITPIDGGIISSELLHLNPYSEGPIDIITGAVTPGTMVFMDNL